MKIFGTGCIRLNDLPFMVWYMLLIVVCQSEHYAFLTYPWHLRCMETKDIVIVYN